MADPRKLSVFLCHSSQDKPIVRELYQRLLTETWIDPWLDEEKLIAGQDWDMEIEKAVEVADVVIVCLSNVSVKKEGYIQKELRFALNVALEKPEETIFIIPLRLDDCFVPRSIRSIQYMDYFPYDRRDDAYRRLMKGLHLRAKSLGLVKKQKIPKPADAGSPKTGTQINKFAPKEAQTTKEILSQVPKLELKFPVCEVCHKPLMPWNDFATCDSCGAKYHKMICGFKLPSFMSVRTCLKCGGSMSADKFSISL